MDATNAGGAALDGLVTLARAGGPVVMILAALSVVALGIVLAKLYQFRRARLDPDGAVDAAIAEHRRGAAADALARLRGAPGMLAPIVADAVAGLRAAASDRATLREEAERRAGTLVEELRSHLRVLEIIAAISPLLGLLGTVLGMIQAFQQMEAAGNRVDPAVLSGGIWEALLTTAVGLVVAIPTLTAFTWLERRVERLTHHAEDAITRVFTAEASGHVAVEPGPAVHHAAA